MWTCPQCGEQHQEQFDACWKCAGGQVPRPVEDPAPDRPRTLMSVMLPRTALGCVAGAALGTIAFAWTGEPLLRAAGRGALVGIPVALFIGVFVWAFFPYAPAKQEFEQHREC